MIPVQFQIKRWDNDWIEATHNTAFMDGASHKDIMEVADFWFHCWGITTKKKLSNYRIDYIVLRKAGK